MVKERKQENNTVCPKEENRLNQLRADVIKRQNGPTGRSALKRLQVA